MVSIVGLMAAMTALGGSVGFFVFPTGLNFSIKMFINLAENGMVFPLYMNPPVRPVSTYYLYAVKNPSEMLLGKKPAFELKGPYRFNTVLAREQIQFNKDGEKVSFNSSRLLGLDEANSANLDEKMWIINPILPATAKQVRKIILDRIPFKSLSEPVVFNTVNVLLDNYKERLIMRTTPRRLIEGRKVKLLEDLMSVANTFGAGALLPPGPPQNIFGLAYVQNHTIDSMEVYTGVGKTRARYAEVIKFRGRERLQIWRGKCNAISGTNGELYKPLLEKGKPLRVFLGPLCRSLNMDPVSDKMQPSKSGAMGLEYEISEKLFQGARTNPDNKCFCDDIRTFDCQYDGLISMGPCFFESPLFFARTNFRQADPRISELVDMSGAQTINGTALPYRRSFLVEPITGTVLGVDLTLMATLKVVRQPYMRDLANVQNLTYVPFFVTNEAIQLPFSVVWQIYYLQIFNDYHKPIMAGVAASGLGVLGLKMLF